MHGTGRRCTETLRPVPISELDSGMCRKLKLMATRSADLAKDSEYEQKFGVRHRRSGRPSGGEDVIFPAEGVHPVIQRIAARRATAVVLEENKDRLAALYARERRVLERRGLKQVAADAGIKITITEE